MRRFLIPAIALVGTACGAPSHVLSGAWEGSCELTEASPMTGETTWDFRVVVAENEYSTYSDSNYGWAFYTGVYTVDSGERTFEGQGMQFAHCNDGDGCGNLNDPFFPTTNDSYLEWAVVTADAVLGYPNVDFVFVGSAAGDDMSGDCTQTHEPWNLNTDQPAFTRTGSFTATRVSRSEEPWPD